MNYHIARGGQTYGPYSEETVRKYLSEGSMQAGDMARTDAMPNWVPLGQLLAAAQAPSQVSSQAPAPPPAAYTPPVYSQPAYSQPVAPQPQFQPSGGSVPPSLHWAIVLVLGFITGIFVIVWLFIQANFVRTIDPASRATRDLAISVVLHFAGWIAFFAMLIAGGVSIANAEGFNFAAVSSIVFAFLVLFGITIIGLIFALKGIFGMRTSIERHYNTVEPINLRLSQVMTFFFSVFYFQYHFTRIADWKRTGVLQP